ncbi:hypothetical protein RYX36_010226, partial [Vicia faba]
GGEETTSSREEENQQPQEGFDMENPSNGTLENSDANKRTSRSNVEQTNQLCKNVFAIIFYPDVLDCFIFSETIDNSYIP